MTWRLIVADDDASYARALADALRAEPDLDILGLAANGLEALTLARETLPDIVLMDLAMPVMGGLEAIRRIKQELPTVEILTLTVQDDDDALFGALQAGAKGYLLKDAPLDAIAPAVRAVAQRAGAIPPALAARVLAEFGRLATQPEALRHLYSLLTRQEVEVIKLIGAAKTNSQISVLLGVELTTIKKQVTSILKKLEVNSRTQAALVAQQSGLIGPGR